MENSLFNLSGKTALITGSSRGLGFAMAKTLGQHGAKIILNGTRLETLEKAAAELNNNGIQVEILPFDVTNQEEIENAFKQLDTKNIVIDVLINNAGIQLRKSIIDLSLSEWNSVIETNLTSAFLISQQVAKRMIQRNSGGKIINIGSLLSAMGRRTVSAYAAAKGGLKLLTQAMTAEWAEHNIQINAIGPGYMLTDMNLALIENENFNNWVCSNTPSKRWGHPEDLGGAAVFLASDASNYVNGQIIYVDGGMLAVL